MRNKVLIVEDEFVLANDLRLLLEQSGYKVIGIAASAEESAEIMQKQIPDLVILDIQLEGKESGIDLARKLKAANIAFIYLSAYSSQKVLEQAKTTEPYGFLVKPFREQDLLVALDIAWYRHQHSLESKLRQEQMLHNQFVHITNESSDGTQKLAEITRAIQPHIPFDLLLVKQGPPDETHFNETGYLRTGYNEYQFIGEQELLTITGLKGDALYQTLKKSATPPDATIYNPPFANENNPVGSLQQILLNFFNMQSYLVFPVVLSNGKDVHYFFYSRQRDIYAQNHIDMLNRLKACLMIVTEKINYHETAPTPLEAQPSPIIAKNRATTDHPAFKNIIGKHPLLLATLDLITQVAPYTTSVLILGESGTGKEKIAQSIHSLSTRKGGPFIKVNCAAIPPTLIESELFGHEKGAFTGAIEKRKGKFEQAEGGTIFLDEIGELTLEMQVKLLRVLQEKEIEYVGGGIPRKVNVRIVAATNRYLEKEVADGNFRLDLYYRLNVFPITLPPLRERKSDINELALYFADKFCKEFNKAFKGISPAMMKEMHAYNWPGNIRELENVLEQSVIMSDGKSPLELMRSLTGAAPRVTRSQNIETLQDVKFIQMETEKAYIISILKKSDGRIRGINGAAELLNLKPTTLESKMMKLGIKKDDFINPDAN